MVISIIQEGEGINEYCFKENGIAERIEALVI